MADKPHISLVIDAHMIGLFRDCEEKYNKRINQLLVSKTPNGATGSGVAFHEGVAAYRRLRQQGRHIEEAYNGGLYMLRKSYAQEMPREFTDPIAVCPDDRRSLPNLERIYEAFVPYEETQKFTYLYIEQSMAVSFGTIETKVAIYDIIYAGIVDAILQQQGCNFVDDLKTTTMTHSQAYKDGFALSQAMMGYTVGMSELLPNIYGAMISGVWFQKEPKSGKGKPLSEYFFTHPLTFTSDQLAEWHANTLRTIRKIIQADETGEWSMALGSACTNYNGCYFKTICRATPGTRSRVIEMDFERRTWTPLEEVRSKLVTDEEWKKWLLRRSMGSEE